MLVCEFGYEFDEVGEDVVFSEDNATWYLTCMGSNAVIVGDASAQAGYACSNDEAGARNPA